MKKIKIMLIILISLAFISCSNSQPPRKIISVNYSDTGQYKITTLEDGTEIVENTEDIYRKNDSKKRDRQERLIELGL